ncbi:hypothetical protein ABBQ32_000390 [Trebouxia sp. C0010 RCD-2024]
MTGSIATMCGCGVQLRSPLQTHSLDRHGSSCGARNRCFKPHQRLCARHMGRGSMLDRPVRHQHVCNSAEPDWDAEMSLFRKRTMKPNQMETVRRLEEEVDIGKVLFSDDGLAILEGLNNDAPVGASLRFVSGASGVLLWRRSDNVCFALILGGAQNVTSGDRVECRLKGILQVEDDAEGPTTKREYEVARVPVGAALNGQAVNFLGCPQGSQFPLGMDAQLPLLNDQLDMKSREQINSPLFTGVKALDTLTPLGRGQAQLLLGPAASGKTSLAVDAIIGQHALQRPGQSPVRCVYASVGHSPQEVDSIVADLGQAGAMCHTTVISAPQGCGLGERYAALCSALSVGEKVRDQGGHSFVVLDDISCMGAMWEAISRALASLGPEALALSSSQASQALLLPDSTDPEAEDPEGLVEYEGMLVSASAAQRRRFFSSLIQRSAQVHRRLKGGSMTMLAILPGQPARGERQPAAAAEDYSNLTPAQRDKLLAALAKRQPLKAETLPGCVKTEVALSFLRCCSFIEHGHAVLPGNAAAAPLYASALVCMFHGNIFAR